MGFKEDADFARYLSMGVVGTAAVARYLRERHGHRPIELERTAMSNKLWTTKVKRLRLPDLVCLRCGLRIESRAKSKLAIVLSDSDTEGRQWHAGGLRDHDLFAFVRVDMSTFPPEAGRPVFFTLTALRDAAPFAKRGSRKAASQGSEVSLEWPSWAPSASGRFLGQRGRPGALSPAPRDVDLLVELASGKRQTYTSGRRWARQVLYLAPSDEFSGGDSLVAGVVEAPVTIDCPGDVWDLAHDVTASDPTTGFAAIKDLSVIR